MTDNDDSFGGRSVYIYPYVLEKRTQKKADTMASVYSVCSGCYTCINTDDDKVIYENVRVRVNDAVAENVSKQDYYCIMVLLNKLYPSGQLDWVDLFKHTVDINNETSLDTLLGDLALPKKKFLNQCLMKAICFGCNCFL